MKTIYFLPPLGPPAFVIFLFAASIALIAASVFLRTNWQSHQAKRLERLSLDSGVFGLFASIVFLWMSSGITLVDFYLPALFASPWAAAGALLIALALFGLRKAHLGVYGGLEIAGACVTLAICGFTSYGSALQRAAALLGAVYFFVRGLDNADKGDLIGVLRRVSSHRRTWYLAATFVAVAIVVVLPRPPVRPPFMANFDGTELPVSAVSCGDLFIVCDEAAWREHQRLLVATNAERASAEVQAEKRADVLWRRR